MSNASRIKLVFGKNTKTAKKKRKKKDKHKDSCVYTDDEVELVFKVMLEHEVNKTQVLSTIWFRSTVCTFRDVDSGAVQCEPST